MDEPSRRNQKRIKNGEDRIWLGELWCGSPDLRTVDWKNGREGGGRGVGRFSSPQEQGELAVASLVAIVER